MAGWLERLRGEKTSSAGAAKERLKLVLIHDRTDLTPHELENMKNDIIDVISRYVEIEPGMVRINMNQEGREQKLVANIPIKKGSRRKLG